MFRGVRFVLVKKKESGIKNIVEQEEGEKAEDEEEDGTVPRRRSKLEKTRKRRWKRTTPWRDKVRVKQQQEEEGK